MLHDMNLYFSWIFLIVFGRNLDALGPWNRSNIEKVADANF